jgi:hypothetical protein
MVGIPLFQIYEKLGEKRKHPLSEKKLGLLYISYKIRPSLTTSKDGLMTRNIDN